MLDVWQGSENVYRDIPFEVFTKKKKKKVVENLKLPGRFPKDRIRNISKNDLEMPMMSAASMDLIRKFKINKDSTLILNSSLNQLLGSCGKKIYFFL